jgi:hypothetical protein
LIKNYVSGTLKPRAVDPPKKAARASRQRRRRCGGPVPG